MTTPKTQPGDQHPEEWRADLNPEANAGQNRGLPTAQHEKEAPTAYDLKEIHRQFNNFTDDELKQIPVLPTGTRLQQGATYVDLQDPELKELTAHGTMRAGEDNWYVPKSEVDYRLWNALIGIVDEERLNEQG